MKITTRCNHISRLKTLISDVWTGGEIYGSPHAKILESLNKRVWEDPGYKRLPQVDKTELRAISTTIFHAAMRDKMIFCYPIEGKWVPSGLLTPEQLRQVAGVENHGGAHIWLKPVYSGGKASQWEAGQLVRRYELTGKAF